MQADDPYLDRYARGPLAMTASEIRALFAVAGRPEVVSLAGGMPNVSALPQETLADIVARVVRDEADAALQYGGGQGERALREELLGVMALEGIDASCDDLVITAGSQQGLDLMARLFLDPGDVVLAEGPSYVGALSAFSQYQAEIRHVPLDADGLVPAALEDALERLRAEGRRAKFLYVVPNYHNPAGVSLAASRRDEVLDLAARHGVLVLEDNPYGLLGFDGEPPAAMRARDPGNVVYLGTLSKVFCPGLRVGWVVAPPALRDRLVLVKEAADLCSSAFAQAIAREWLARAPWPETVKVFREVYRERRDAMLAALDEDVPASVSWTAPRGGFYVWLGLPQGLDARAMLAKALAARVAYVPGSAFYADGQGSANLRLSYCLPPPERIREGVRRLAGVLQEELELGAALHVTDPGTGPTAPRADAAKA